MRYVAFPDGEAEMVKAFTAILQALGETGIKVSTQKSTPQQQKPMKQIVIRSDGGTIFNRVGKEEDFGVNLYVQMSDRRAAYAEANRLASIIEGAFRLAPQYCAVKYVTLTGSTPIEVDGEEQQRYLRLTATLQGTTIEIETEG